MMTGDEKKRAARRNIIFLSQVYDTPHDQLFLCNSCLPAVVINFPSVKKYVEKADIRDNPALLHIDKALRDSS